MTRNLSKIALASMVLSMATSAFAVDAAALGETVSSPTTISSAMDAGIAADLGSTAIGLGMGAAEANPLGLALIPLKMAVKAEIAKIRNEEQRREVAANFTGAQWGAAAANVCSLAAATPVGALVCFAGGALVGRSQVMAVPTTAECFKKHEPMLARAAASGRRYEVDLKTCSGHFVMPAEVVASR